MRDIKRAFAAILLAEAMALLVLGPLALLAWLATVPGWAIAAGSAVDPYVLAGLLLLALVSLLIWLRVRKPRCPICAYQDSLPLLTPYTPEAGAALDEAHRPIGWEEPPEVR